MHQQRLTRLLSRRQERQLWLVLLTLILAANVFLLLFLHSPWVPPGPLVLDYPHHVDSRYPAFQPDHHDLNSRGRLQSGLKVKDRTGDGELPQHATRKPEGIREEVADNAQDFSDSREPEFQPKPERGVSKNRNQEPSLSRELEPKPEPERAVSKDMNQDLEEYPELETQPKLKQAVDSKDVHQELGDYPEPDPKPKLKQTVASKEMNQEPSLSHELEPKPKLKQTASKGMNPYKKLAVPLRKPVQTVGKKILKGTTKNPEDKKRNELTKYIKPIPKPQPAKKAEANKNNEVSKPGQPTARPPQANQPGSGKTCDQNGTLPLPWLHKPDNMTNLEQVIHSLEVVNDTDEESWKTSSYFQPRSRVVTAFRPGVLIDSVRCPPKGPRLLILIPSTDVSVRVRQAIRETWASPAYGAPWPGDTRNFTSLLKVVFVMGMRSGKTTPAVEAEAHKFRDIVQLDFQESYLNLSLKMALAVEWSAEKCRGAGHVMKTDEDTFVELSLLLDLLQYLSPGWPRFILGSRHCKDKPIVVRHGKWGVSGPQYPFPHFPRYLYGHSYVLSSEAVREVRAVWRRLPLIPNEDAFLTGIVAKVKDIPRIHCEWFANDYRKTRIPREELANGRSVTQTGFKPFKTLYTMWEMLKKVYGEDLMDIPNLYDS